MTRLNKKVQEALDFFDEFDDADIERHLKTLRQAIESDEKIVNLHDREPHWDMMADAIIAFIDERLPNNAMFISILGLLELIKQHYIERNNEDE